MNSTKWLSGLEQKLLAYRRIDSATQCWIFTGALDKLGYGRFQHKSIRLHSHRISAHLYLGLDLNDKTKLACHKEDICPNNSCFNPDHLYVGTYSSNAIDWNRLKPRRRKDLKVCKWGHEFTPENTIISLQGSKVCRVCNVASKIRSRARQRALLRVDDSIHTTNNLTS